MGSFSRYHNRNYVEGWSELRCWDRNDANGPVCESSVLGVIWNEKEYCLSLHVPLPYEAPAAITKRLILPAAHKIFDPLGWTSPTVLLPKLILQRLWSEDVDWDTKVPQQIENEFSVWLRQLPALYELRVPRWIFGDAAQGDILTFHAFVDASMDAYAAALFVRVESSNGVRVQLIQAKSSE